MFKVLLVDDEPHAIKTMTYIVDWQAAGYEIIGHASNGLQALEMMDKHKDIQLLVTDLRMPRMDGIELIREVRAHSDLPIIVTSGYDDFEYAKQCIRYGVKDYLLKPMGEHEVLNVLQSVKGELESRAELNRKLCLGLPALQDKLLWKWTHGFLPSQEEQQFLKLKSMLEQLSSVCVMLVEMDFMEVYDTDRTQAEIELKRFAVRNVLEEAIGDQGYIYDESDERYGVVLFHDQEDHGEDLMLQQAKQLQMSIEQYTKVQVTIGLGVGVSSLERVPISFRTACHALEHKYFKGIHSVIEPSFCMKHVSSHDLLLLQNTQAIIEQIRVGNREEIISLLDQLCGQMTRVQTPKPIIQLMVMSLCVHCYELLLQYSDSDVEQLSPKLEVYEEISNAKTIVQLFDYAERKCLDTLDQLKRRSHSQSLHTVLQVKQCIEMNYASNISLKSIAEMLYMNATYLGKQFKAAEGMTFNDYLLQVRMEKAKDLLQHTSMRVYEVAAQVGYQELDWFYKKFKDYTGMSTSKYRMEARNNQTLLEV